MQRIDMVRHALARARSCGEGTAFARLDSGSRQAGLPGLDVQGTSGDYRSRAAEMAAVSTSMKANTVPLDAAQPTRIMERAR